MVKKVKKLSKRYDNSSSSDDNYEDSSLDQTLETMDVLIEKALKMSLIRQPRITIGYRCGNCGAKVRFESYECEYCGALFLPWIEATLEEYSRKA